MLIDIRNLISCFLFFLESQVVGSAYYTAPEVLKGAYDYRCDTWSLGIIAYMLLSGAPPFNGDSSDKLHYLIQNNEPDFSMKMFPKAQPRTVDFLKQLLVKDPAKRISIENAFQHPFLQQTTSEYSMSRTVASFEVVSWLLILIRINLSIFYTPPLSFFLSFSLFLSLSLSLSFSLSHTHRHVHVHIHAHMYTRLFLFILVFFLSLLLFLLLLLLCYIFLQLYQGNSTTTICIYGMEVCT